ncbi:MAG: class I SAM-dependent methyltransferase [Patescibacteria group bacterium]
MISTEDFWDKTWSRKYHRYNLHHQAIWDYLNTRDIFKGNVLDLGCGPCVMYKNKDIQLTGVDWSEEGLRQAKINYPRGTYICGDATKTSLPSDSFDTILACGLLDLFDNWKPVIIEAQRLLKLGGKFYATLLQGYSGHDWTQYPHVTGNWHLIEFTKEDDNTRIED